jgi:hypothetical protein
MIKITFVGLERDREQFLQHLQEIGAVHLIFPRERVEPGDLVKELGRVTETCKFLAARAGTATPHGALSAREVCEKREILGQREARLQTEITALKKECSVLEAWGDFPVQEVAVLRNKGVYLQFFRVSPTNFARLPLQDVYHQVIRVVRGEICFITVAGQPVSLEVPPEKLPSVSLSEIRTQLAEKQAELEQIASDYAALAMHLPVLKREQVLLTNLLEHRRDTNWRQRSPKHLPCIITASRRQPASKSRCCSGIMRFLIQEKILSRSILTRVIRTLIQAVSCFTVLPCFSA